MSDDVALPEASPEMVTRYAGLSPRAAWAVIAVTLVFIACCVRSLPQRIAPAPVSGDLRHYDVSIYKEVVERVQAGEGYYEALGTALRSRGRATRSVLNWRTPLQLSLLGWLPSLTWGRCLLGLGAVIALLLCFRIMTRGGPRASLLAPVQVMLMLGPLAGCFGSGDGVFFGELWAGVAIAISIGAYAFGHWRAGLAAGLLALFLRELALPYVLVCLFFAAKAKRRSEIWAWVIGIAGYAVYLGFHAAAVHAHLGPSEVANPVGWAQFGGLTFVLRASSVGWLLALPRWATALYVPLALLGLAGWKDEAASRVLMTVSGYMAAYAIVGFPFSTYWGALYAPLLTFGVSVSPLALGNLWRAARGEGSRRRFAPPIESREVLRQS
jgi:hypothetical protein